MSDLISRQEAIDKLNVSAELLRRILDDVDIVGAEREKFKCELELIESCVSDIKELPSAVDCQKCIFQKSFIVRIASGSMRVSINVTDR